MLVKLLGVFSFLILSTDLDTDGAKVISYKAITVKPSTMECSELKFTQDAGCICVTGLWRIYSDCSTYYTIAGNAHCFPASHVNFAMELISSPHSIVLIQSETSQVINLDAKDHLSQPLQPNDLIVTSTSFTINGPLGHVCLFPQEDAFCTYQPQEFIGDEMTAIERGCPNDFPYLNPLRCNYIKGPQTCEEADKVVEENLGILEQATPNENKISLPRKDFNDHQNKRLQKRSVGYPEKQGRTFLGAPGQEFDIVDDKTDPTDEDYIPADVLTQATDTHEAILSEIWNYVEGQTEVEMEMRKRLEEEINYGLAYFKLLHLSKKVMQKICPQHYVPPKFFDIAVQTFIQVQIKRFVYDPPNANYPGFMRIQEALENCQANLSPFPFLPLPPGEGPVQENATACTVYNGTGEYFLHNSSLGLNISEAYLGLNKDPIVETVWKIFSATQSYCFPYFSKIGYNDHHRYITWLTPLFQNQIHDIWMNGKSTNNTYGQFLGNMEKVMQRVAYCAASSRFSTSNVTYPWELPRPAKVHGQPSRRKRH